jgi:hypothetical protein
MRELIFHTILSWETEVWESQVEPNPDLPTSLLIDHVKALVSSGAIIPDDDKPCTLVLTGDLIPFPFGLKSMFKIYVQSANYLFCIIYPWYD